MTAAQPHEQLEPEPRPRGRRSARLNLRGQGGQVLVLMMPFLVVMFALASLAIDVSFLRVARHHAQIAADAGALAGADDSQSNGATVTTDATTFAHQNSTNSTVAVNSTSSTVSVKVTQNVPLLFGGLFGLTQGTVSASATAAIQANTTVVPDGAISPNGCVPASWGGCEYSTGQSVGSGTCSNNWCVTTGTVDLQPCSGGGGSCTDPKGNPITNEVVDLNGSSVGGMIETVATVVGKRYVLTFDLTGNPNGNSCTYDVFTGNVVITPVPSGTATTQSFTHTNTCSNNVEVANFQTLTVPFTATQTSTTLAFNSTTNTPGNYVDYGPEVTNIALAYAQSVLTQ